MKKYNVGMELMGYETVMVFAENEEEAKKLAIEKSEYREFSHEISNVEEIKS